MYETIKDQEISCLDRMQLNAWIETEVVNLANDFGQNIAPDQLRHICERLRYLLSTKYKSWAVAEAHAVMQNGLSGAYGVVHKVTFQKLVGWFKMGQQQRAVKYAFASEKQPRTAPDVLRVSGTDYGSFMCWLTRYKIWVTDLVPEYDATTREIPPQLRQLASEFAQAKEGGALPEFRRRLMNKNEVA